MRRKRGESSASHLSTTATTKKRPNTAPATVSILQNWFMEGHDASSLTKLKKDHLVELCRARGLIQTDEQIPSKPKLVEMLIHWKLHALPPGGDAILAQLPSNSESMPNLAELNLTSQEAVEDEEQPEKSVLFDIPSDEGYGSQDIELAHIPFNQLTLKRKIGSGAFKTVYRGRYQDTDVAIGKIETSNISPEDLQDIENETKVLKQLSHDNIVKFIGISKDVTVESEESLYIITEYCHHGDLSDYMRKTAKPSFQRQLQIMYDIAFGCSYLHNRRPSIIHRDLKSLNILVDSNGTAKIGDFGFAKIKSRAKTILHTVVGTPNWQAPEMWVPNPNYTEKVDVYSCGLIFWEILQWSNTYPFGELQECQIYEKVGKDNLRPSLKEMKKYPKKIIQLVEEMWDSDPDARPSMAEVITRLSDLIK